MKRFQLILGALVLLGIASFTQTAQAHGTYLVAAAISVGSVAWWPGSRRSGGKR